MPLEILAKRISVAQFMPHIYTTKISSMESGIRPFPNGLLSEQQGWKFVSSKYKWLENAHQARFGSNWLLWNGKNQLKKKKIAEKKFFLEIFWTTRDCMEFQSRVITWPCGIVWIFNPWWSKNFQKFFFRRFFFFSAIFFFSNF